jgi:hypothetical protein
MKKTQGAQLDPNKQYGTNPKQPAVRSRITPASTVREEKRCLLLSDSWKRMKHRIVCYETLLWILQKKLSTKQLYWLEGQQVC